MYTTLHTTKIILYMKSFSFSVVSFLFMFRYTIYVEKVLSHSFIENISPRVRRGSKRREFMSEKDIEKDTFHGGENYTPLVVGVRVRE